MTTEMNALPESVKAAYRILDAFVAYNTRTDGSNVFEEFPFQVDAARTLYARVQELEREKAILEIKNRGTLANNMCPDHRDKQTGKPCLACTIETLTRKKERTETELAAINKRVADSGKAACADDADGFSGPVLIAYMAEEDVGKTFALLPLDDEAKS